MHCRSRSAAVVGLLLSALLARTVTAQSLPEPTAAPIAQDYDQVTAYMPHEQAETASVALARLVIILHDARKRAVDRLCDGNWTPSGTALQKLGPSMERQSSGHKVWFYQSLRQALPLACGQVSREQFFVEMNSYLPVWVVLRPADQQSAVSQSNTHRTPAITSITSR